MLGVAAMTRPGKIILEVGAGGVMDHRAGGLPTCRLRCGKAACGLISPAVARMLLNLFRYNRVGSFFYSTVEERQ
jgi:hypothetical protein